MDDPEVFRGKAKLLGRNWLLFLGACSSGFAGIGAVAVAKHLPETLGSFAGVVGVVAIFTLPFIAAYTWFANPRPRLRRGEVVSGPQGVMFRGRTILPRRSIRAGFTIPQEKGVLVQLERRFRRPVELLCASTDDARALLKSLGLDASQTAVSVPLRSLATTDYRRFIPGLSMASLVVGSALTQTLTGSSLAAFSVAFVSLCVFLVGVMMLMLKARATVAADGVLVSFLWDRRFYPYNDIARVTPTYLGYKTVALVMKNGRSVHLPIPRYWSHAQELSDAQRLTDRIQTAMREHRRAPGEADYQALARKDRPVRAWIDHLLAVGAGANADHRRAPVPAERLWRIVETPTEDAETRAAAAVALTVAKDGRTKGRLQSIASNTALPKLRIALEAAAKAAEDEAHAEDEVSAALDALSPKNIRR